MTGQYFILMTKHSCIQQCVNKGVNCHVGHQLHGKGNECGESCIIIFCCGLHYLHVVTRQSFFFLGPLKMSVTGLVNEGGWHSMVEPLPR